MAVRRDAGVLTKLEALAERFFADAAAVDGSQSIPSEHLDGLAEAGLYGVFAPVSDGGLGLGEGEVFSAVELLASACLASTFVWVQHFGLLGELLEPSTPAALKAELLRGAVQGHVKGGLALAGLLPGPPRLRAVPAHNGWLLEGEAPWVSGWGVVDLLVVAARGPDETVVRLLVDAKPQSGLSVSPLRLSALDATATVRLGFGGVFVGGWRCTGLRPYDAARQRTERLRLNGSLALGVARRCCALIGPSPLDEELTRCRAELDAAGQDEAAGARARASELALRASSALSVHRGSGSVLAGDVAERLRREAAFLLVFGSRPAIKEALLALLEAPPPVARR